MCAQRTFLYTGEGRWFWRYFDCNRNIWKPLRIPQEFSKFFPFVNGFLLRFLETCRCMAVNGEGLKQMPLMLEFSSTAAGEGFNQMLGWNQYPCPHLPCSPCLSILPQIVLKRSLYWVNRYMKNSQHLESPGKYK